MAGFGVLQSGEGQRRSGLDDADIQELEQLTLAPCTSSVFLRESQGPSVSSGTLLPVRALRSKLLMLYNGILVL